MKKRQATNKTAMRERKRALDAVLEKAKRKDTASAKKRTTRRKRVKGV